MNRKRASPRIPNYTLHGIPPGSSRRLRWQSAADRLGIPLSDLIRDCVDLFESIYSGNISPESGVEIIVNKQRHITITDQYTHQNTQRKEQGKETQNVA